MCTLLLNPTDYVDSVKGVQGVVGTSAALLLTITMPALMETAPASDQPMLRATLALALILSSICLFMSLFSSTLMYTQAC